MAQLPVTVTNNETFPRAASYFSCYPEARRTLSIRIGPKSDWGRGDLRKSWFERGIPVVVRCTRNSECTIGFAMKNTIGMVPRAALDAGVRWLLGYPVRTTKKRRWPHDCGWA